MIKQSLIIAVSVLSFHLPAPRADNDLQGHWSFDNCDGGDDSGNGFHGVMRGSLPCAEGVLGSALQFSPGHYIELSKDMLLDGICDFTISAWINNQAEDDQYHQIFGTGDGRVALDPITFQFRTTPGNNVLSTLYKTADVGFTDTQTGSRIAFHPYFSDVLFEHHRWYKVSLVLQQKESFSNMSVYVNDRLIASVDHQRIVCIRHDTPMETNIGAIDGGKQGWIGMLDEIRVYRRALSANEIRKHYWAERSLSELAANQYGTPTTDSVGDFETDHQQNDDNGLHRFAEPFFDLALFDMDGDWDLDAAISQNNGLFYTFWLNDGTGRYDRALPEQQRMLESTPLFDEEFDGPPSNKTACFHYQVQAIDRDGDNCYDGYILFVLGWNEVWHKDQQGGFLTGGHAPGFFLQLPDSSKVPCGEKPKPGLLLRHLAEISWRPF